MTPDMPSGLNASYDGSGYLTGATVMPSAPLSYSWNESGLANGTNGVIPTKRINHGVVVVQGSATTGAVVTINSSGVSMINGFFTNTYAPSAGTWQTYTVQAQLAGQGVNGTAAVAEKVKTVFVPPINETLGYDASGNRTTDARWNRTYNTQGQITSAWDNNSTAPTQIDYIYDWQNRLVQRTKRVAGVLASKTVILYDGLKPLLEMVYNGKGIKTEQRLYTWGPDVSGSIDGAAGVGGLVGIKETRAGATNVWYAINDGKGSVAALADGTGVQVASYIHGPFGEVMKVAGEHANGSSLRWQSKYYDEDQGLYYFPGGGRWYDPRTQARMTRDPIREGDGGNGHYTYTLNQPYDFNDPFGLSPWSGTDPYIAALTAQAEGKSPEEVSQAIDDAQQADIEAGKMMTPVVVGTAVVIASDGLATPWVAGFFGEGALAASATTIGAGALGAGAAQVTSNGLNGRPLGEKTGESMLWGAASMGVFSIGSKTVGAVMQGLKGTAKAAPAVTAAGGNIVYRALNVKDVERLTSGLGLEAKNPTGSWSLGDHIALGSGKASWANDPWIATTPNLDVARAFDGGRGIVAIDLDLVPSQQIRAWELYPRVNGIEGLPYHYSIWQQETSIFQSIPREAIIGPIK